MRIKVKRFQLKYDGKIYKAGSFADLPFSLAEALVKRSPNNYELVQGSDLTVDTAAVTAVKTVLAEDEFEAVPEFETMTVAQLKAYARSHNIKFPTKAKRDQLVAILRDKFLSTTLPEVDLAGTVV